MHLKNKILSIPQEVVEWIKKTFQPFYQDEVTYYLSKSVDQADLEARVKTLKHRGFI